MHGLIIREPWISHILEGRKTWEMRTSPAPRRGVIALIRKGTGRIVGTAEIIDSLPPLDSKTLATTRALHCIPPELDIEVLAAGWTHPWVLHNVQRLSREIRAGQKPGQVIWVPLDADVSAQVKAQNGKTLRQTEPEMSAPYPIKAAAFIKTLPKQLSPAQRAEQPVACNPDDITVILTDGAIRNGNLSIRKVLHLLPEGVVGGPSGNAAAANRLTVVFEPGETVETDVAGDKMLLRCRGAVSNFFARTGAKGGDIVRLRQEGEVLRVMQHRRTRPEGT